MVRRRDEERPTVLVVDADTVVRQLIAKALKHQGFRSLIAATATECLEILRENPHAISLVITDIFMPKMSGLDLATELSRRYPHLKLLYISGAHESIGMRGIASGCPEIVLRKPFTAEMLAARVRQLCAGAGRNIALGPS